MSGGRLSAPGRLITEQVMAISMIGIIAIMVLPLPTLLLDVLLATSLAFALIVFLFSLHIEKPLDFSSFPSLLLVLTLSRLALNVSTTRTILLRGGEGSDAAGSVIQAFGHFVVGGNTLIGIIVFLILVIVNFVVITKGAGRVAEVSARFMLDSLPGKQMAIDADLSAGIINEAEAKARRSNLEQEADFFGAMDGASKFVRGDAIAGIIITLVNIIGGLLIGMMQNGMSVGEAAATFTQLTVGDGLVSQIPALLTSVAAGLVTTRSAAGDNLAVATRAQLFGSRQPLVLAASVLGALAVVPGMPHVAFGALALSLGAAATRIGSDDEGESDDGDTVTAEPANERAELESNLPVELLEIEVGYELVPLVDAAKDGALLRRIAGVRKQVARELGVLVPPIHLRDNMRLPPGGYRILLSGAEVASGEVRSRRLLAMNPAGDVDALAGEATKEPAFGLPARWIDTADREVAEMQGCTVVDPASVVATHLGETISSLGPELIGRRELQELLDVHSGDNAKVVEELVPTLLSNAQLIRILHNLLRERVSIRDFRTILEALADHAADTKDADQLTELVRQRLSRQLCAKHRNPQGKLAAAVLSPDIEQLFRRMQGTAQGGIDPNELQNAVRAFERGFEQVRQNPEPLVLLTAADIRRAAATFAARNLKGVPVLSYREIDATTEVKTVAVISLERSLGAGG